MPDCTVYKSKHTLWLIQDIQAFFQLFSYIFLFILAIIWIADSMLEDIPAAYSQRQDTLLDHCRALSEHLEVWYLVKGHLNIVVEVSWPLFCFLPSIFCLQLGLETRILYFSAQSCTHLPAPRVLSSHFCLTTCL